VNLHDCSREQGFWAQNTDPILPPNSEKGIGSEEGNVRLHLTNQEESYLKRILEALEHAPTLLMPMPRPAGDKNYNRLDRAIYEAIEGLRPILKAEREKLLKNDQS
jgi:hypothetical protein